MGMMIDDLPVPTPVDPDTEVTIPGTRTIVGFFPVDRPPWSRMPPGTVEFAESFCAEPVDARAIAELSARMMAAVDKHNREVADWMELACSHVLMLGYAPEDCRVECADRARRCWYLLRVHGVACFEVVVIRHWDGAETVTTVIPRVIGWPPRRG